MAKTTTTATPTLDDIKSQQDALKEQAKALKEAQAKAKEEAKKVAEKEAKEAAEAREAILAELKVVDDEIEVLRSNLGDAKCRRAAILAKLPKGTKGTGAVKTPKDPEKLSAVQMRIVVYLAKEKSATRKEIGDACNGGQEFNGSVLGNADSASRNPYSLLGRGLVEMTKVDGSGEVPAHNVYSLTQAGKTKAKECAKQLAESK
jgi:hypothetical protein